MKPDRWRQVDQLFQAALERAPEDRAVFINEACGGDDSLRREVEALLAADGEAGNLIETPAYAVAAPLIAGEEAPSLLGKSIGHFQIISLLGKGGMGEVYAARDTRLDRKVALKLLPAEFTTDAERVRRFEREARAASALNHPNILTIYDIGVEGGRQFIAAELVEGVTLRQKLAGRSLPLNEAVEIAIQIASALDAAHSAGIVHRDIKPENVMLRPDGLVKVLDFGLAKLTEAAPSVVDSQAATLAKNSTEAGVVLGTPRYMSPEQARGLKADARTDIFSLGVVLYELLTCRPPFEGATMSDVIAAVLTAEPAPLTQSAPAAPPELERIVSRALRKDRESRYQTSRELLVGLKEFEKELKDSARLKRSPTSATSAESPGDGQIKDQRQTTHGNVISQLKHHKRAMAAGFLSLALVAISSGYLIWSSQKAVGPSVETDSIVALPAQVLGTQELNYLTDAIPSTLSTHLANVEGLATKAPPTSIEFERAKGDLGKIADLYGVKNCVVSSITAVDADRFALNVKLVDCRDRRVLWSKEYEGRRGSYIEMARQAADGILHKLKPGAAPIASAIGLAATSEAELAFRQGQYFWNRYNTQHQLADFDLALDALKRALALDHNLADAAAEIALLYIFKFEAGAPAQEMISEVEIWANRALEINSRCSRGWAALAAVEDLRPSPNRRKMFEYGLKAASFGPQDSFVHNALGVTAQSLSLELCLAAYLESRRLDPLFLHPYVNAGEILRYLGRSAESLALEEEALKMDPDMPAGMFEKSATLLKLGRINEAAGLLRRLEREAAQNRFPKSGLALLQYEVAVERGDSKAAEASLRGVLQMVNDPQTSWFDFQFAISEVVPYLAREGKTDLALQMLTRSPTGYALSYDFLMLNPHLSSLRADARFQPIVTRSRAQFDETLKIVEEARSRGEAPQYLDAPLAELLKKLRVKE